MSTAVTRGLGLLSIAALVAALTLALAPPSAGAAPDWAPAAEATIRPGVQTVTDGGQCTANFIFTATDADAQVTDVYIGQAAHCASTGDSTGTNGCDTGSLPVGTPVDIEGASRPGTLAYSSWLAMQEAGETDRNTCEYNDFALVRIDPADHDTVNPTVPFWGGPVSLDADGTGSGEDVYSYGNSGLRFGIEELKPKKGYSVGDCCDGWTHDVYTVTPGIFGDSGSAFLDAEGDAFGVLATVAVLPYPASNGVTDLAHAMHYMHAHGGPAAQLEPGTEDFTPRAVPIGS